MDFVKPYAVALILVLTSVFASVIAFVVIPEYISTIKHRECVDVVVEIAKKNITSPEEIDNMMKGCN